jgi:peptidoglycan hydrolase CwlO-like protein
MFSKTIRYTALILVLVLLIAWVLSFFYKKFDSKDIKKLLKSSADSIEYAKVNINNAQNRIDTLLLKLDSINDIVSEIEEKVNNGNSFYQTSLQKNKQQLDLIKEQIVKEQSEIDNFKEQLKHLK